MVAQSRGFRRRMDEAGQGIVLSSPPKCGVPVARVGRIDRSGSPRLTQISFNRDFALATPCAHVPGCYAEPSNFKIGMAHPWSWAIGSSTSAAQRSFDVVVSRQKARPFVLSTKWGLQENGRPSLKGMAPWPGPCSVG